MPPYKEARVIKVVILGGSVLIGSGVRTRGQMDERMIALKVGDLTARLGTSPELRDVRLGGQPTLNRVSLTVRDPLWVTITGSRAKRTVETSDDHVYVRDQWSYPVQGSSLDAVWEVRLDHDRLDVRAEVTAQGSVGVNRASLCLLHPLESVGTGSGFDTRTGPTCPSFATEVNPHRVFEEVTGMTFALPDGRRVDLDFGGDLFETEDHRNWSDAGWRPTARHWTIGLRGC